MPFEMTPCRDCGKQFQIQPLLDLPAPTRCLECMIGLEAKVAVLEAELRVAGDTIAGHNRAWADRCEIAEAEVARLRTALEEASDAPCACVWLPLPPRRVVCGGCIARRALAPPPEAAKKGGEK